MRRYSLSRTPRTLYRTNSDPDQDDEGGQVAMEWEDGIATTTGRDLPTLDIYLLIEEGTLSLPFTDQAETFSDQSRPWNTSYLNSRAFMITAAWNSFIVVSAWAFWAELLGRHGSPHTCEGI